MPRSPGGDTEAQRQSGYGGAVNRPVVHAVMIAQPVELDHKRVIVNFPYSAMKGAPVRVFAAAETLYICSLVTGKWTPVARHVF